jgi:hypothetical protein
MLVIVTTSLSISTKLPIPALANASDTKEPTPPNPKIATLELFNFIILSLPIISSVLEN